MFPANIYDWILMAEANSGVTEVDANELAQRALSGCVDSFATLSQRYRPRLIQLLMPRVGGCHAAAEDIAQEALLRAFQRLDQFKPEYRFSTWLYAIALRIAHDHARRLRRVPTPFGWEEWPQQADNGNHVSDGSDGTLHVWEQARGCLSESQFAALWLRFGEDFSIAEVAVAMRKSQVGVRVLLHRARTRLFKELRDLSDD